MLCIVRLVGCRQPVALKTYRSIKTVSAFCNESVGDGTTGKADRFFFFLRRPSAWCFDNRWGSRLLLLCRGHHNHRAAVGALDLGACVAVVGR